MNIYLKISEIFWDLKANILCDILSYGTLFNLKVSNPFERLMFIGEEEKLNPLY